MRFTEEDFDAITYHCVFCKCALRFITQDNIYTRFKCDKCNMSYYRTTYEPHRWLYLDNRYWSENYGKWVICTKKMKPAKEKVVFT